VFQDQNSLKIARESEAWRSRNRHRPVDIDRIAKAASAQGNVVEAEDLPILSGEAPPASSYNFDSYRKASETY